MSVAGSCSPSVGPAGCWGSIARPGAGSRRARDDEDRLIADMIELARQYGRYSYGRIAALLRDAGWQVNEKRVERLWRREGLKVPGKQPRRGRLWLNDGSCVRLRAELTDHVWSYDFAHHRTHDGRAIRTLNVLDEFTREGLAIRVRRKLFLRRRRRCPDRPVHPARHPDLHPLRQRPRVRRRGRPAMDRRSRSPHCLYRAEFTPGSTVTSRSFNARLRDKLLNGEIFYTLREAQVLTEAWRRHYNAIHPHSSLACWPRAPETTVAPSWPTGSTTLRQPPSLADKLSMH